MSKLEIIYITIFGIQEVLVYTILPLTLSTCKAWLEEKIKSRETFHNVL